MSLIPSSPTLLLRIKQQGWIQRLRKTRWYCRWRARLTAPPRIHEDWAETENAERVLIDWPAGVRKPAVGVVQDYEACPRWTKYCRFLKNNGFAYGLLNLHAHDWLEQARRYDVVTGICSCDAWHLHELREKYPFLENYLGIKTYPSPAEAFLYEDKKLESYLVQASGLPHPRTLVSYDRANALQIIEQMTYPCVSKVVPGSGSIGVEWVRNKSHARRIIASAFSAVGRKTDSNYARQKNYVFFQEYVPNDGYDVRVIVVGHHLFGYYRKVPSGDFRASGMGYVEKRDLPHDAMALALRLNDVVKSPMLVVDMVRALTGQYLIIEFSPVCQMDTPEQLHIRQVAGAYEWNPATGFRFRPGRVWVHELALREFLLRKYLPGIAADQDEQATVGSTLEQSQNASRCSVQAFSRSPQP